jgi:hypothetical protein
MEQDVALKDLKDPKEQAKGVEALILPHLNLDRSSCLKGRWYNIYIHMYLAYKGQEDNRHKYLAKQNSHILRYNGPQSLKECIDICALGFFELDQRYIFGEAVGRR